ncbi:MAG TPA: hypothetical protein VMT16_04005, partial [Thermoanaerobaculia bacterium]|nr:hypothetical protein [Thermoanaerobaculia bacterium]
MAPRRLCTLLPWILAAVPAAGQGPAAEWRTLETARYRVHYPAPAAEWAAHVAARLEAIRDR